MTPLVLLKIFRANSVNDLYDPDDLVEINELYIGFISPRPASLRK